MTILISTGRKLICVFCMLYFLFSISVSATSVWAVDLNARVDAIDKGTWTFGTGDAATDKYDNGLDLINPPIDPTGFDMYFSEPGESGIYSKLRNNFKSTKSWFLVITVPSKSSAYIAWDNSNIPSDIDLFIQEIDSSAGTSIGQSSNMKSIELVSIDANNYGTTRVYEIESSIDGGEVGDSMFDPVVPNADPTNNYDLNKSINSTSNTVVETGDNNINSHTINTNDAAESKTRDIIDNGVKEVDYSSPDGSSSLNSLSGFSILLTMTCILLSAQIIAKR